MKSDKNILVAFLLNISFSVFELFGGFFTGSVAILSDSLHDFGDALSIGLSYFLEKKSKKKPNYKYTYGYVRYSIIGSIITTIILLVGSIFVVYESVKRIINPITINYDGMIVFAIFGVIINSFATYFTHGDDSLNQKAVNLHMLEDVLGWIIVLIGSILMKFTNIIYIDSILSIIVALIIFISASKNIKIVVYIFLEKTPDNIHIDDVKKSLLKIPGVEDVHHIHVRSIDGYNNFATLHVVVKKYSHEIKCEIREDLVKHHIDHSTIELELIDEECDYENCKITHDCCHHHHH